MGYVYDDGPPPLGLRYQINSVALNFQLKPWFEAPKSPFMVKRKTRELQKQAEIIEEYNVLIKDEQMMEMGTFRDRLAAKEKEVQE